MGEFHMSDKLFADDGHISDFAMYSWGDLDDRFHEYVRGYKKAADCVVAHALELNLGARDCLVAPIVFLYRQYIELRLKRIYLLNSSVSEQDKKETIGKVNHSLSKMWDKVKDLLFQMIDGRGPNERATEIIETIERYVKEFDGFDPESIAFRYPIQKSLDFVHQGKSKEVNLRNLAEQMDNLDTLFWGIENELHY